MGGEIDTKWHRYYKYFTGKFDAKYFPEIIFSTQLEPILNPRYIAKGIEDKSLLEIMYRRVEGLYIPKTIVLNASGIFYDGNRNVISIDKAKSIICDYLNTVGDVVIKPIRDTNSGKNVELLHSIESLDLFGGKNYIVQELVQNQEDIRILCPKSLNTFRVMTYICKNRYWCGPILLRLGSGTSHLDNAHAGGMFIGIKDDGSLNEYAFTEYGKKYSEHPYSKVIFDGYKIGGIDKVRKTAIECHKCTPHLKMISWDMTIDKNGRITLIEANLFGQSIWLPQIAHGRGFFESNTEDILLLLNKK